MIQLIPDSNFVFKVIYNEFNECFNIAVLEKNVNRVFAYYKRGKYHTLTDNELTSSEEENLDSYVYDNKAALKLLGMFIKEFGKEFIHYVRKNTSKINITKSLLNLKEIKYYE